MSTIFKRIIDREIPADIIYEDDVVLAFLDIHPVRKGHTLVIPKEEYVNIFDAKPEVLGHMMIVAQKVANALMEATEAKGINIHMNNGHDAGQDVPHAHLHVIPRFKRGEVFQVPEHETYEDGESVLFAEKIKSVLTQ